jgi:hypothetical protein
VIEAAIQLDIEQVDHLRDATERAFQPTPRLQPDIIDAAARD